MKRAVILLAIFSAIALIGFQGCNKPDNPIGADFEETIYSTQIASFEEMAVPSDATEVSLERNANLLSPKDDPFYPERPIKWMFPLGRILKQLNLTDEQKEQVRTFLQEYRDCVKNAMMTLRQSERQIIEQANQERLQIRERLQNGEITKEEAYQLMRQLNERLRQALMNNPVRQEVIQMLKDCYSTLIDNIKSILTPEQLQLFEELLAKYAGGQRDDRPGKGPGTRP